MSSPSSPDVALVVAQLKRSITDPCSWRVAEDSELRGSSRSQVRQMKQIPENHSPLQWWIKEHMKKLEQNGRN
eukprot:3571270-Prymnesium_polylepis.2